MSVSTSDAGEGQDAPDQRSRMFEWGAASDVGQVRTKNQDSHLARDGLFVVADGMGGHSGGEVASALAIAVLAQTPPRGGIADLVARVRMANDAIIAEAGREPSLAGMGTTLCAVALLTGDGTDLGLVNVGDSRIYLFADDALVQISEDHSLVETLVREGRLEPDAARTHPQRNVVTRALGIDDDVLIDYWVVPARQGTRLLLCSDGLVGEVSDEEIAEVLGAGDPADTTAARLVSLANEGGGHDNITVIVIDIVGGATEPTALPGAPRVARGDVRRSPDRAEATPPVDPAGAARPAEAIDRADDARAPVTSEPRRGTISSHDVSLPAPRPAWIAATLVVVAIVVMAFVGRYARDNYFVTFATAGDSGSVAVAGPSDDRQVVIFQGRPGGVLWFDPTLEETTAVLGKDLTPALVLELEAEPEFASIREARRYVDELLTRLDESTVAE
jgi:serine/threonine protein phosphatase PrpC